MRGRRLGCWIAAAGRQPVHYCDTRTDGAMEWVFERCHGDDSSAGIQFMQLNTLLAASMVRDRSPQLEHATHYSHPDPFNY